MQPLGNQPIPAMQVNRPAPPMLITPPIQSMHNQPVQSRSNLNHIQTSPSLPTTAMTSVPVKLINNLHTPHNQPIPQLATAASAIRYPPVKQQHLPQLIAGTPSSAQLVMNSSKPVQPLMIVNSGNNLPMQTPFINNKRQSSPLSPSIFPSFNCSISSSNSSGGGAATASYSKQGMMIAAASSSSQMNPQRPMLQINNIRPPQPLASSTLPKVITTSAADIQMKTAAGAVSEARVMESRQQQKRQVCFIVCVFSLLISVFLITLC